MFKCILCFSPEVREIEVVSREQTNYSVLECSSCKLVFTEPMLSKIDYKNETTHWRDELNIVESYIEQKYKNDLTHSVNILEIGAGDGRHIIKLKSKFKKNLSAVAFDIGINKKFKAEGSLIKDIVLVDDWTCLNNKFSGFFDIIYAFHVLEHVENVYDFISSCISLLKPNGVLILSVPNPNRGSLKIFRNEDWDYPPYHLTRWSKETLIYLQRRFNLKSVNISETPLTFKDFYIFVIDTKSKLNSIIRSVAVNKNAISISTQNEVYLERASLKAKFLKIIKNLLIKPIFNGLCMIFSLFLFLYAKYKGYKGISLVGVFEKNEYA